MVGPKEVEIERLIYLSRLAGVGTFRSHPHDPSFKNSGPVGSNLMVFPRTAVRITHEGREPVIANPNTVIFYNAGQVYQRGKISERGDNCDWFSFSPDLLVDAMRTYDSRVEEHAEKPYSFNYSTCDPRIYLQQRLVVEYLLSEDRPDALYVEEAVLRVLERTLDNAFRQMRRRTGRTAEHHELVHAVQALLGKRFGEQLTIQTIAAEVHYSPYHLCRIFRQVTGTSIHRYLTRVRLHTALEMISDGGYDLADVAFRLQFSSHSHFTQAFKKAFGAPPSEVRDLRASEHL